VPYQHVTSDGFALYNWLASLRRPARRDSLAPDQRAALDALGFGWEPLASQWQAALAQLRAFRQRHGHTGVPLRYVTASGLKLGNWLSTNRRARHAGTLPEDRIAALEQLGVTWDPAAAAWDHNLSHLAAFRDAHGHVRVPQDHTEPDGCKLGRWVSRQRHRHAHPGRHPLTPGRIAGLAGLGMILDPAAAQPPGHDPSAPSSTGHPGAPARSGQPAGAPSRSPATAGAR
jgi:hypothetical protein